MGGGGADSARSEAGDGGKPALSAKQKRHQDMLNREKLIEAGIFTPTEG